MADTRRLYLGAPLFNGAFTFASQLFDQNTDAIEWVFRMPESVNITRLGVRKNSNIGTTPTLKLSVQGVTSAGIPDGIIKGGGSPASVNFLPSALTNNNFSWLNLDNPYQAAKGEMVSFVMSYASGTIDGSNGAQMFSGFTGISLGFPTVIGNNGGVRANVGPVPLLGFGSATKAYGYPVKSQGQDSIGLNTTPDEWGVKFSLPQWAASFKVLGFRFCSYLTNACSILCNLYDASNNVLQHVLHDTDYSRSLATNWHEIYFDDTPLPDLRFGTTYRVTFSPQEAANHFPLYWEMSAAADFDAWEGGQDHLLTTRTNGGAWTDTATRRPFLQLIVSDITPGGVVPVGLSGGIRG